MKFAKSALAGLILFAPLSSYGTDNALHDRLLARAENGETQQVLAELEDHLQGTSDRQLQFLRARVLEAGGHDQQAIEAYRQLIEDYPDLPEPYNNLAALLAQRGELKQAQQLLEQAMRTHPAYAAVYDNLSVVFVELARDSYGKALRIKHEPDALAMQQLAELHGDAAAQANAAQPTPLPSAIESPAEIETAAAPASGRDTQAVAAVTVPAFPSPGIEVVKKQVRRALDDWATAWSKQAVGPYLDAYAEDYSPADMNRRGWQQQRRQRLTAPAWIEVKLSNVDVTRLHDDRATVRLTQRYRSNTYQDLTRKRIKLQRDANGWRIVEEITLEQLPQ